MTGDGRSNAQRNRSVSRTPRASLQRVGTARTPSAAPTDVFVLDFDGVICDSEPEVSTSAMDAAAYYWPELFRDLDEQRRSTLRAALRRSRPRLVEGFEAMVMARLLAEDPSSVERILLEWEAVLSQCLTQWREDPEVLKREFEGRRRRRMQEREEDWVALNPFYPGVAEALQGSPYPFYIASSKAASRLWVLLQAGLPGEEGLGEGSPRVFASLIPPNEKKVEALRTIMSRPLAQDPSTTLHFIDDRFETVEAVAQCGDLRERWDLHFANWGYSTEEEREVVAGGGVPGVKSLGLAQMCELLRWGIVMGVDDGCEPTAEEVEEGVAGRQAQQR